MMSKSYSKKNIYGNYQVLSPDEILMFRCDEKKANWYLNRNLAEKNNENTIKLKFKPKGLGNHNKGFGLSEMKNICVNCGKLNELNRHHVVPYCYRKYFPLEIKSHNFHDVLSLCVDCHESYERKADELKEKLAIKYDAPINGEVEKADNLIKYIKIAKTLYGDTSTIPSGRIELLKKDIKSFFGIKRLSKARLKKISEIKSTIIRKTHGEIVISQVNDVQKFVEMWREHFITNNECKHLPENWNIKYKICLTKS